MTIGRAAAGALLLVGMMAVCAPTRAIAQQRPNVTEDPETVGSGRLLFETGVDYDWDVKYPLSGLTGNLLTLPSMGVSIGLSAFAELQIDGGLYQRLSLTDRVPAPLSPRLDIDGVTTTSTRDILVGAKVRLLSEQAGRPAIGTRFATRLPLASTESGLGRKATDFTAALLVGKTIESVRVVGNIGVLLLADPLAVADQDRLMTYGVSLARAVSHGVELVAEVNGRRNFAEVEALGAEDRGLARLGGRVTRGAVRLDGGILLGLSPRDPGVGLTGGLTWVFDAFRVP